VFIRNLVFKEIYFNLKILSSIIYIMTKQKKLFTMKNNKQKINMNVDEALYNHFQTLSPLEQKAVMDMMILKMHQDLNE